MTRLDMLLTTPQEHGIYAIAATHNTTGQRLLIKVSSLATREQLQEEIRRLNNSRVDVTRPPVSQFTYSLTTEGRDI